MKRFAWPLQRLLDVRNTQETLAQNRLAQLSARLSELMLRRQQVQAQLDRTLGQLGALSPDQRLWGQPMLMACAAGAQRTRNELSGHIEAVRAEQAQAREQYLALRRQRRTLENLRQRAQEEHERLWLQTQQAQLDEAAQVAFSRKLAARAG